MTILTESQYVNPSADTPFIRNLLLEDNLVREALERRNMRVDRCSWDDPAVNWAKTDLILFRSTWDYFDRFSTFDRWLEKVKSITRMINPYQVIRWNMDKHYLEDLSKSGVPIPPTLFIEKGDTHPLARWVSQTGWKEVILKPVISGAARHTYKFIPGEAGLHEEIFRRLIKHEAMMIQEFQRQVPVKGEVAFMVMGGRFTHAVIKKAKKGDFRVQDDFGGTVHPYKPTLREIEFAEMVVARCGFNPLYARVDVVRDNMDKPVVLELELIEPELWFRFCPEAANHLAEVIYTYNK